MSSFFFRFAGRTGPSMAAAALAASSSSSLFGSTTHCEAPPAAVAAPVQQPTVEKSEQKKNEPPPLEKPGFQADAKGYFYNMIPMSQLYQPKLAWPYWDGNWDGREPSPSGETKVDRRRRRYLRQHGVTRHIILIRHGQYDETHKEDEKRILTDLGRRQADETGKRLAQLLANSNLKVVRVSTMARAQETADIIASHLPDIPRADPDPLLNEGRPAHTVPSGGKVENPALLQKTQEGHERIERAFQTYFCRAPEMEEMPQDEEFLVEGGPSPPPEEVERHEYEIIVCHANVIRYFLCRALQLPPEAWLRLCTFNCSLTYLTIRPTGGVSCRLLGDVGHLSPELISFSGHHGFDW